MTETGPGQWIELSEETIALHNLDRLTGMSVDDLLTQRDAAEDKGRHSLVWVPEPGLQRDSRWENVSASTELLAVIGSSYLVAYHLTVIHDHLVYSTQYYHTYDANMPWYVYDYVWCRLIQQIDDEMKEETEDD